MMKYSLITAVLLSPIFLFGQSEVVLDTFPTIDSNTLLVSEVTYLENGAKNIKVISMLINDENFPVPDTTLVLSKNNIKSTYYQKKNGEHIFYTKLPDGGRYEGLRTGYPLTKSAQITILKCIYSNIEYPKKAIKGDIEGRFQLEFYVNTSGCIQDVLLRGIAREILIKEAKRAAHQCDCQFPVLKRGDRIFPTTMVLPMKFLLE